MAHYDPFQRGVHPVGTRSFQWRDAARDRALPIDVWYPADEALRGQDLDPATQDSFVRMPGLPTVAQQAVRDAQARDSTWPLIVFSHGFGGERRQSTFYCTHLASHGYVVVAMDHVGNTTADMLAGNSASDDPVVVQGFMRDRPADCSFVIDRILAGAAELQADPGRIGITGHSFGGWTSLMTAGTDARIRAVVALAPAGGRSPDGEAADMAAGLVLNWGREVPVLMLVADRDTILPLAGMRDLDTRITSPHRTVVLGDAEHFHFCDNVEQTHDGFRMMMTGVVPDAVLARMKPSSDYCPGEQAYDFNRGLGLAHFDAFLRHVPAARALLDGNLVGTLAARSIRCSLL
jgi:predicted dienelactone hydrolase